MIKIENEIIEQSQFGDGTLKCPVYDLEDNYIVIDNNPQPIDITWCYDNDSELFTLWCLVNDLRQQNKHIMLNLIMPYIPHARQDRNVSGRLFTLKYFANLINQMNFEHVYVLDPHSDVSTALIDRVELLDFNIYDELCNIKKYWLDNFTDVQVMFPDNGAAKKYNAGSIPAIIGYKHRNKEGRIDHYELNGLLPTTSTVIIRDDISSFGGTFVAAAKELRKAGVKTIILAISHCENNILKGEIFNYIDEVWTTDSICTVEHPKLNVVKLYRENKQNV